MPKSTFMLLRAITGLLCVCLAVMLKAQPLASPDSFRVSPEKYLSAVTAKAKGLEQKLDKKSARALAQLKKQEEKIIRKLSKIDSSKAKELAATGKARYEQLEAKLRNPGKLMNYVPGLDSLATTVNFLNSNSQILSNAKEAKEKIKDALDKVDGLKAQLQKAEDIKAFLKERKQFLVEKLKGSGLARELKQVNKQAYYYAQQLNEYKEILNDPKKIEKKALELLARTGLWKKFFREHSMLASLFPMPGNADPAQAPQQGFAGLQTRVQLNSFLQQNGVSGPNNSSLSQLQQNITDVQGQIEQVRNKINGLTGAGGKDPDMPDFKVNSQKTKSFFKRLIYGTNIQSQKSRNLLPATTDIGLSLAYKINDVSAIGIGTSYRVGWGSGWNNIKMTSEGVGLRSFLDIKIKNSWWISGGYEQNFRSSFNRIDQLKKFSAWQRSGLIGMTKTVSLKSKFLKSTKVQLLWDLLSDFQTPKTQKLLLRIGYNFK